MLEAGLASVDSGVRIANIDSTPLPKSLHNETSLIMPEYKKPNSTALESRQSADDYLAKLTKDILAEAQEKDINLDEIALDADVQIKQPPKKTGLVGRVKGFFSRVWSWTRKEVDELVMKLEKFVPNQKKQSGQNKPGRSVPQTRGPQTFSTPQIA